MRDVLSDVDAWTARGDKVAIAMVVGVKRSAPRPRGAKMAISSSGDVSGAVSGGCVEGAVVDWSGGTRIGASMATLNRVHGRRLGRGSVVVILSDGWDRGDPALLAEEMARLRRSAHRVIWLNPLKASPDYEPLARGMAAALPHTDHFLAGNSLRSLAELAELLEGGLE